MTEQDNRNMDLQTPSANEVEQETERASVTGFNRTEAELEGALGDLFDVGRMWASHGLTIGKLALQNSARTLEVTATALETIAKRFDEGESEPRS